MTGAKEKEIPILEDSGEGGKETKGHVRGVSLHISTRLGKGARSSRGDLKGTKKVLSLDGETCLLLDSKKKGRGPYLRAGDPARKPPPIRLGGEGSPFIKHRNRGERRGERGFLRLGKNERETWK